MHLLTSICNRPAYEESTREETTGFWARSFFIWLLPFFRIGSSKSLSLEDVPHVDSGLKGDDTYARLEASWPHYRRRRFGLARATLAANA
jgi:ATP-binding cassette subfamily C (CFTR/MRP) protein 1